MTTQVVALAVMCRTSGRGWIRQSAAPTDQRILTVELLDPAMTAVVTDLPFTGHHLTGSSGSCPVGQEIRKLPLGESS